MSDKVFLDTNIIIYSYSSTELEKQVVAQKIIAENDSYISTQVLTELCNTITRKFKLPHNTAIEAVRECCNNNKLFVNNQETIEDVYTNS